MEKEARKRFAEAVRKLRAERTPEEFAVILGVSRPSVLGWEQCKTSPKRESLEKIAAMRGESLDDFLSFIDGAKGKDPLERLIMQIAGLSNQQLALVLRAVANRLDPPSP